MVSARSCAGAALVAIALGLAGCGAPAGSPGVAASTAAAGSGTYPNLNVPLTPAAPQLTPQERAATADELRARRTGLPAAGAPTSSQTQLRQIGSTHSQDAIRRIEAE